MDEYLIEHRILFMRSDYAEFWFPWKLLGYCSYDRIAHRLFLPIIPEIFIHRILRCFEPNVCWRFPTLLSLCNKMPKIMALYFNGNEKYASIDQNTIKYIYNNFGTIATETMIRNARIIDNAELAFSYLPAELIKTIYWKKPNTCITHLIRCGRNDAIKMLIDAGYIDIHRIRASGVLEPYERIYAGFSYIAETIVKTSKPGKINVVIPTIEDNPARTDSRRTRRCKK